MSRRRGRTPKNLTSTGEPIPGGGTKNDIAHLSRTLGISVEAVEEMMASQGAGRGLRSNINKANATPAVTPAVTNSAWADFMNDEMKTDSTSNDDKTDKKESAKDDKKGSGTRSKDSNNNSKAKNKSSGGGEGKYILPIVGTELVESCVLAQTGTLDTSIVGRGNMNIAVRNLPKVDLCKPTILFPKSIFTKVQIGNIAASASSCHCIVVDTNGGVYSWGRNEDLQLGLGPDVPTISIPRKVTIPGKEKIRSAAVGKHHSVLIGKKGGVFACGKNNMGQLGINSSIDGSPTFKRSFIVLTKDIMNPDSVKKNVAKKISVAKSEGEGTTVVGTSSAADGSIVKFVQVACGENFSVILSSEGHMYTTGSSEFGQLGNGATGEYFVSASKLAFSNCNRFEPRTHFVTSEESSFSTGTDEKKVDIKEDIRIGFIACGKNHTLAVEAKKEGGNPENGNQQRAFSWGCGDYGCLGHGVQADEYYPRQLTFFRSRVFAKNNPAAGTCGAQDTIVLTEKGHGYFFGKHRQSDDSTMRPALLDALASNGHIVTGVSAGAQSIICCTKNGVTVTWGNGPYGDLGYGADAAKSSAQPKFVPALDCCLVTRVASGYGCTLFLIKNKDNEDKEALKKLDIIEKEDVEEFEAASIVKYKEKLQRKEMRAINLREGLKAKNMKRKQNEGNGKKEKKVKM